MSRPLRRVMLTVAGAVVAVQMALAGVGSGQGASEGELTRIGGNGPSTCERTLSEIGQNSTLGLPTAGLASTVFRSNPGMRGVAANLLGEYYVAYDGYILGPTSVVAGKGELASDSDGVPPLETGLPKVAGIALHPRGRTLWVLQASIVGSADAQPGRIRRIQLGSTDPVTTLGVVGRTANGIAADGAGNVYVTESEGAVTKLDRQGQTTALPPMPGAKAIAVDVTGTEIFIAAADKSVYRLRGSSYEKVAGPDVVHNDGSPAVNSPASLAIGHEIDAQGVWVRYLYIGDAVGDDPGRVVRVELGSPRVINTVAGGGPTFVESTRNATSALLQPRYLAADMTRLYIAAPDQCALFQLITPPAFRLPAEVPNSPGGSTNTTLPPDSGRTSNNDSPASDPAPSGNPQMDPGTGGQPAGQGNQTQIVPGSETQVQPQPQTELRVIDQGNVVATPEQAAQPTAEPVPTPGPAAQFTPTPAATPTAAPTPAPDAGSVVVSDPGPTSAAAADASAVVPPAPAAALVPPAPASAPPPAAQEPVSTPGLIHGDSAAPARGGTRYAMVRNDEEQSLAALAMAGAGAMAAVFLCVLFVAPGASSKPKPRPKGAY